MAEIKWLTNGMVDNTGTEEFPKEAQQHANTELTAAVEAVNPMKEWLIDYVGEILKPADGNVTVEMIIHAFGVEFPEMLLALAEENWMRGYSQALHDAEKGMDLIKNGDVEVKEPSAGPDSTTTENDTQAE
jgi:hypothetical protein